jgi:predicted SprT family Zn-dependent metalloprotease
MAGQNVAVQKRKSRSRAEESFRRRRVAKVGPALLASLAKLWKYAGTARLRVVVNPRLKSTIARWLPPSDTIEISRAAESRPNSALREIICHEAAHVVVWNRFGRASRPHGPEWAALMRAAGVEPHATLMRCGARRHPTKTTQVRHVCTICHFSALAKRRMPQWRCPECRSIGLAGKFRMERVVIR